MKSFLTDQQINQAPPFPILLQISVFILFLVLVFLTLKYGHLKKFQRFFLAAQAIQLVIFNSWHLFMAFSWENSLPIFHCRLAMWAILLIPDKSKFKQYFALMGLSGAFLTFAHPVMDHYAFPHITAYNFIFSHILLFANSLIYLYRFYDAEKPSIRQIIGYTFLINALLTLVNQLTGGNYGLLRTTPFIADQVLWVRYLAVSFGLIASMLLFDLVFRYLQSYPATFEKMLVNRSPSYAKSENIVKARKIGYNKEL